MMQLNIKERSQPIRLVQLKAIERRLPNNHKMMSKIRDDIFIRVAGFRGEQSLDYYLNFFESDDFMFLHDLCLKGDSGLSFQMDTVAICPQFIAMIEVKNYAGKISYNEVTGQWLQKYNHQEKSMQNPFEQPKRQRIQLANWLIYHQLPPKPIIEIVVFTNPYAIIEITTGQNKLLPKFTLAENLSTKLEMLKKQYHVTKISKTEQIKFAELLTRENKPPYPPPISAYHINQLDIRCGVFCSKCKHIMYRQRRSWQCEECHYRSKKAHIQALEDYYLLIKPTISNEECRNFLNISSPTVAHTLLSHLKISRVKKNRYTYYDLTYPLMLKGNRI